MSVHAVTRNSKELARTIDQQLRFISNYDIPLRNTAKNDQISECFHIFGNIWKVDVSELINFP